jgi:hypothetical protein
MSKHKLPKIDHARMTHDGDGDITKPNPYLKSALLDVVDNQLRDDTPPVARETFERLQSEDYTDQHDKEI